MYQKYDALDLQFKEINIRFYAQDLQFKDVNKRLDSQEASIQEMRESFKNGMILVVQLMPTLPPLALTKMKLMDPLTQMNQMLSNIFFMHDPFLKLSMGGIFL